MSLSVNLKTIAQEAGVSIMTASRALNGTGYVSKATTERVRKIAEKHRYRPNLLIRGVQTGRTMNVGVILPAKIGFYTGVLEGMHREFLQAGYSIQLGLVEKNFGAEAIRQEHNQILRLLDMRVDGIVLRPVNDEASDLYFEEVFARGIHLVVIDRKMEKVRSDFVGTADFAAGRNAAEFLLERGHRNILLVASGDVISSGRDRRDGFLKAIASVKDAKAIVVNERNFEYEEPDVLRALQTHPEITAAFCVADNFAGELYRTAHRLGLQIPGDLSVLGFGNLELGRYLNPPLSTFDQHPLQLGVAAAQMLLNRIQALETGARPKKRIINAQLLDRQSIRTLTAKSGPSSRRRRT